MSVYVTRNEIHVSVKKDVIRGAIALLLLFIGLIGQAAGQSVAGYELTKADVVSGRGVLNKGLGATAIFGKKNQTVELSADDGQGWGAYDLKFGPALDSIVSANIALTTGLLNNTWWFGPRASLRFLDRLTLMVWPGWTVGEKFGEPAWNVVYGWSFYAMYLDVGPLTASYTILEFEDNALQKIPGISGSMRLNHKFKLLAGAEYDMTNDDPMFRVGLSYKPKGF